jgi:hypothetical protein
VGEFVVREAVEAVGAVAKTRAGQAVTGAARAAAAKVVPALRALGTEADETAVDVGLGWMPNAGKSVAAKLNATEAAVKQELAAAWKEARTPWTGPVHNPIPSRMARVVPAEFVDSVRLGAPGAGEAWVTAADDLGGITTSEELASALLLSTAQAQLFQDPERSLSSMR